jgi:hypothetical protein
LNHQAAISTSKGTSWPLGHSIGVTYSTKLMKVRTGLIAECRAVEGAAPVMAMNMLTVRIWRIPREVRKGRELKTESRMAREGGWQLTTK